MRLLLLIIVVFSCHKVNGKVKTIHVYVALCDNEYQGIVRVPKLIGNGKDTKNNLYWGAGYGLKTYLKSKSGNWKLIQSMKSDNSVILERLLFKHVTEDVYLLADAYDGEKIKTCIEDFLKASNGQLGIWIQCDSLSLGFGGHADLISYIGHDGLMDFNVSVKYNAVTGKAKDVIILACYSKAYFSNELRKAQANPVLWTTHLMAPEAYTLDAAMEGWIHNASGKDIAERAAQAYHKYQNCGIKGARNLFASGL